MELFDFFFLISFIVWICLGFGIYRKFYTSIEKIISTTEIKRSRAVEYRAEHLGSTLKSSIFFCIILSLGVNLIVLQIYSWFSLHYPEFSYNFFLFCTFFVLLAYPLGELTYLAEKENEAETPYHRKLRSLIRKIIAKVKGKTEAILVFSIIFYVIPILILVFGLNFDFLFSIFIVFMIYPLLITAYFIGYAIVRLFTPALFLHNLKNLRFYVGMAYVGIILLFEVALLTHDPILVFISILAFLMVFLFGIIKELRYRPIELTHLVDDVMRPFEYIHGSFLLLSFGVFMFLVQKTFLNVNFIFIPLTTASLIENIIMIQSILIPVFLILIIVGKAKSPSRALVVALARDSLKLNASIKSRFIHEKTLIESIEKSINKGYIRPEYTPKLSRLLENEDVHVRRKAIILLRKITEEDRFKSVSIVPKLLNFLKADDTWSVRLEAAESLTQMMNILPKIEVIDVLKFLSELNADKNRYVRWGIIKLFSSIALAREDKISEITPFLLNGLMDEEWSVRKGTVESFNRLIDNFPDIIPIVVGKSLALLNDEDTDIIKELFTLFRKVTGTDVNSDTLQIVGSQIAEKAGPQYKLDSNLFESALKKVKEATKPAKFVFKKSDLPEK